MNALQLYTCFDFEIKLKILENQSRHSRSLLLHLIFNGFFNLWYVLWLWEDFGFIFEGLVREKKIQNSPWLEVTVSLKLLSIIFLNTVEEKF